MGVLLQELYHRKHKKRKSIAVLCDPDTLQSDSGQY